MDRKNQINGSYNLLVLVITTIASLNVFFLNQDFNCCIKVVARILIIGNFISILLSIFYLVKSFSNFHKSLFYKELPSMNEILSYENDLMQEQKKEKKADYLFNDFLKSQFADCATHNFLINKTRTEDIAKSKIGIFVSICLTFVICITFIFNIL